MFSNAASNWLHSPTGYICLTFTHCVFSNVSSSGLSEWMQNHTGCTCLLFLRCVFSNIPSDCLPWRILHLYGFSPMFQMFIQMLHTRGYIVTLVTFVFLQCVFSNSVWGSEMCLNVKGSKFWIRNTFGKVKSNLCNRF